MSQEKLFNVYKVQYRLAVQDPDMPQPRYHTVVSARLSIQASGLINCQIFVETKDDKSGIIHHVVGDLVTGMTYQKKSGLQPENSQTFHAKQLLGKVKASKAGQIDQICAQVPPPGKQKKFNPKTMKTEPVKANGDFYKAGESRPRLIKCTEWTVERAIPALQAARIFQ